MDPWVAVGQRFGPRPDWVQDRDARGPRFAVDSACPEKRPAVEVRRAE